MSRLPGKSDLLVLPVSSALLTAWMSAVLLAGREPTRPWIAIFLACLAAYTVWWWCYRRELRSHVGQPERQRAAAYLGSAPALVCSLALLGALLLSDGVYAFVMQPSGSVALRAVSLVLIVSLFGSCQIGSLAWLDGRATSAPTALAVALKRWRRWALWGSLVAVGILQGMASASPIGDDIGQYSEAAAALIAGSAYPIHQAAPILIQAGMTANSPAMPLLPVLLAASFLLFGQNTAALVVPLAGLAALFPVALFAACRAVVKNDVTAYITALLVTLFPVYQIHVLGTPVPDTLFVVVLLATAAFVAKAVEAMRWRDWIAAGISLGMVANSRHEGLSFSVAILLLLLSLYFRRKQFWAAVAAYLLSMAPFALTYLSVAGSIWPGTFGGTVSIQYLGQNVGFFLGRSLPWYEQAIGLDGAGLLVAALIVLIAALAGTLAILRSRPALLFIPGLGVGYLGASLLIHPLILMSYSPVDGLRHWSSAIPYLAISAACGFQLGYRALLKRMGGSARSIVAVVGLAAVLSGLFYEADRLALPETGFGGPANLLWTASGYLLTDVVEHPLALPPAADAEAGLRYREEQKMALDPFDLRVVNRSAAYHWATLYVALFGLLYVLAPARTHEADRKGFSGASPDALTPSRLRRA